jgi:ribonucleoside-diphosphate reductase alpha chain
LNLGAFAEDGTFDYKRLEGAVHAAIRFLDDVIEINNYPLPEIERMAKGNRRIGLGVMGYAEACVKMGVAYDSPESLAFAAKVMRYINDAALSASEKLASERGVFPNWKDSIYDKDGAHYRGEARTPRHCARTTIAPTGTIAIAAGLQGSGIEPFFAIAYTRYNAKALDAIKKGETPAAKDVFFEVNPLFKEIAEKNDFFGMKEKDLWSRIDENHKGVRGIKEIPENIQRLFTAAHDVSVETHVKIQAAFQKHVDNGVSKTINLPNSATVEDVRNAYQLAYEMGCKGITIYRDGSKAQQVLNLAPAPTKSKRRDPSTAFGVSSEYYQIKTGYGPLHIHINYDERGPYQVFTNIPPLGTEISALTSLVGILLSKYLAEGGDPLKILKHLNSVKGDKPLGFGEAKVNSIAHAISIAMRQHLKKTGWLSEGEDGAKKEPLEVVALPKAEYCPKCYSSNVAYESGCSGPTCHDCGFSECS